MKRFSTLTYKNFRVNLNNILFLLNSKTIVKKQHRIFYVMNIQENFEYEQSFGQKILMGKTCMKQSASVRSLLFRNRKVQRIDLSPKQMECRWSLEEEPLICFDGLEALNHLNSPEIFS